MRVWAVVVAVSMALGLAACGSSESGSASKSGSGGPKVAALFTQSISQGNWDPNGYHAFKAMADKYGFTESHVEKATYEKAPAILRDLASKGTKLIVLHSSGYASAVEQVAPSYPDTQFVVFSYADDTKGLKNYAAWSNDWDQYGFIAGVAAGHASKNGNIAIIGAEPIPSSKREIEFVAKGIKHVRPDAKVSTTYIGSWDDTAKAAEIANQAINKGADMLVPIADTADAGVYQAAEQHGVRVIAEYRDESSRYPKAVVTSTILDMDKAYDQIGEAFKDGKLAGQIVQMNVQGGHMHLTPMKNVDAGVEEQVQKVMDDIHSGKLDVAGL